MKSRKEESQPKTTADKKAEPAPVDDVKSETKNMLINSGLIAGYEYFLKQICKHGLPSGDIFEYAALQIQRFEKKHKAEQMKKKHLDPAHKSPEEVHYTITEVLANEKKLVQLSKEGFDFIDTLKAGSITDTEVEAGAKKCLGILGLQGPNPKHLKSAVDSVTRQKKGRVSFEEFSLILRFLFKETSREAKETSTVDTSKDAKRAVSIEPKRTEEKKKEEPKPEAKKPEPPKVEPKKEEKKAPEPTKTLEQPKNTVSQTKLEASPSVDAKKDAKKDDPKKK